MNFKRVLLCETLRFVVTYNARAYGLVQGYGNTSETESCFFGDVVFISPDAAPALMLDEEETPS